MELHASAMVIRCRAWHEYVLSVALHACSSMAVDKTLRRQGAAQALLSASEQMAGVQSWRGSAYRVCMLLFTSTHPGI
jgi:GNAT superfamily N-acetyltransferase